MSSSNPAPATTQMARGAFRITKAVMKEAVKEAKAMKQEKQQQRQAAAQHQQQHDSVGTSAVARPAQPGAQPMAKAMPVARAVPAQAPYVDHYSVPPGYAQQSQPYPAVQRATQQHERTFRGGPTLIGTTLGWNWAVNAAVQETLAQQFVQMSGNEMDYFSRRWRSAVDTPLVCCFLILEIVVERVLVGVLNMFVMTFGNLLGSMVLLPSTIYHMYRSIICISPRVMCQAKFIASLCLPFLALLGVFTITALSFAHGLCVGFLPCPRPLALGSSSVATFFTKGHAWRKEAYRSFESPEGPIYDFPILNCLLVPIFVLIGMLFNCLSFLIIAILEAPRMCYHLTFSHGRNPNNCCFECCVCLTCCTSVFYAIAVIFVAPVSGLVSGVATGYSTAMHAPTTFLSALWTNNVRYLDGLSTGRRQQSAV